MRSTVRNYVGLFNIPDETVDVGWIKDYLTRHGASYVSIDSSGLGSFVMDDKYVVVGSAIERIDIPENGVEMVTSNPNIFAQIRNDYTMHSITNYVRAPFPKGDIKKVYKSMKCWIGSDKYEKKQRNGIFRQQSGEGNVGEY